MNDTLRYVVVLGLITMLSAATLSFVYNKTKEPIAQADKKALLDGLKNVLPEYNNDPVADAIDVDGKTVYIAKINGVVTGYALESTSPRGYGGDVTVLVGATPNGKLYNIEVIQHTETPGLGDGITRESFTKLFKNEPLTQKFAVKTDGGKIDQFSGATVSPRAVCDAVNLASPAIIQAIGESNEN